MRDFNKPAAQSELRMSDALRSRFAEQLGVAVESLRRLYVGYDGQALTFPMRRPDGFICGIRRRFPDGRKLSVRGGREGLFIPMQLADTGPLVVTEGPTDCAALLSLGFAVVGRPSCTGGTEYVKQLARGRDTVVAADGDEPGQRGAISLAQELNRICPSVTIIIPPAAFKDARAWLQAGATRQDIESTIAAGV